MAMSLLAASASAVGRGTAFSFHRPSFAAAARARPSSRQLSSFMLPSLDESMRCITSPSKMFPPRHHIYQHYQSVHHVGVGSGGIVSDRRWKMTMMANDDASMQQACTSTNSDTSFTYTRLDDDDDDDENNDDDDSIEIIEQPHRTMGLIFFDFIRCIAMSANVRCLNTQLMPIFMSLGSSGAGIGNGVLGNNNKMKNTANNQLDALSVALR